MKNRGFTLIELLVVVAIIGILAAVGVVAYNGYTASAKRSSTDILCKQIIKEVTGYQMIRKYELLLIQILKQALDMI